MSASDSEAVITTAASAGCGRFRNRPGTSTIIRMISAAPVTPVSCVCEPGPLGHRGARGAGADREALEQARRRGWPHRCRSSPGCRGPPGRCARRTTTRSRSCRPARPARCRARRPTSGPRSDQPTDGMRERREALRQHPDQADAARRRGRTTALDGDRQHHHDQHGRHLGQPALQHQDHDDPAEADGGRGRDDVAVGQALDEADALADQALGVDREAEQLRQLADQDGQRPARSCSRSWSAWTAGRR